MHAREDIAGVALRRSWHGIEECLGVARLAQDCRTRTPDCRFVAAKPVGGALAGCDIVGVETLLHTHLMVGGTEHAPEHFEHSFFDFGAELVIAPGMAHQRCRSLAIALREQGARQHKAPLGGRRLLLGEEGAHHGVIDPVVPQRVLGAAAEQWGVRPARIGLHESGVALEGRIGVVGAQDYPFGELARNRIGDARLGGIGVRFLALAGRLDDAFHRGDIGGRGGGRRCDGKGPGGRSRERLKKSPAFEYRAMQADIGLREG